MENDARRRRVAVVENCVITILGLQHLFALSGGSSYQFRIFRDSREWLSVSGHCPYDIVIYSIAGSRYSRQQSARFFSQLAVTQPGATRVLLTENERQASFIQPLLPVPLHAVICKSSSVEELDAQIQALMTLAPGVAPAYLPGSHGLSPTERRILDYMRRGYSSPEIAIRLARNIKTIRAHKFNLMSKLGVKSDTWLICAADVLDYLPSPPG